MITRQDLIDAPNFFLSSNDELDFVEVWENLTDNKYYLWDLEDDDLYPLVHGDFKDFMDAAETFEQVVIKRQPLSRQNEMNRQIIENSNHRANKRTGAGAKITVLPI